MSWFGFGSSSSSSSAGPSQSTSAPTSSPTPDPTPSPSPSASPSSPSPSQNDAASFLQTASISPASSYGGASFDPSAAAPTASALLSSTALDPARLHPMANIGDKLDYLLLDDDKLSELPGGQTALPTRGWSDDLCYGVGTTYVSGLGLGGLWGLKEGLGRPLAVSTARLRLNAVLNAVTRRGSFLGNSGGVLALVYNLINSSLDAARGKHDVLNSIGAGALSGALFKSTAGVRPAAIAAGLMATGAGGWSMLKRAVL